MRAIFRSFGLCCIPIHKMDGQSVDNKSVIEPISHSIALCHSATGSTVATASKPIANYPLSIVHCALLIVFLLFAGMLSAQDNYSVIVKCYPAATNGTGHIIMTEYYYTYSSRSTSKIGNNSTTTKSTATSYRLYTYSTYTGSILAMVKSTYSYAVTGGNSDSSWALLTKNRTTTTSHYSRSSSSRIDYQGWVNFNISRIPRCATISGSNQSIYFWQTSTQAMTPSTTASICLYHNSTASMNNNSVFWNALHNGYIGGSTYTITQSSTYNTFGTSNYLSSYLNAAIANGATSFLVGIVPPYSYTWNTYSAFGAHGSNSSSRQPYLVVEYSAPWSCIMSPSVKTTASSVCANDGVVSLTASQAYTSSYVSVSQTKTWQWYSGTNGSNGSYVAIGGTFTANSSHSTTVRAPSNTGTVWYKYCQTVGFMTNSTLETKASTYSITCRPASVAIGLCCTPLTNPTVTVEPSNRAATLRWSQMQHVSQFKIRYSANMAVGYKEITLDGNATSVDIPNLTNGRTYYFQIRAIGQSGFCDTQFSVEQPINPVCN